MLFSFFSSTFDFKQFALYSFYLVYETHHNNSLANEVTMLGANPFLLNQVFNFNSFTVDLPSFLDIRGKPCGGVVAHSVERVSRGDHGFDSHSSDLNFLLVRPTSVKCVRLVMVFVFSLSVAACEIFRDGRPLGFS